MIGQMRPGLTPEDARLMTVGVAQVDAVQAQQGKTRRVSLGGSAVVALEGFVQVIVAGEGGVAL
ncbi:hypothetical protein D3C72_2586130 [compost metagenome]